MLERKELCSPTTAGYYGVRRPFPSELDFHGTKQLGSDAYPSPLASKPFSCDPSAPQGCPALLEPYLSEQFGDHRAAAPPLSAATSSFFSAPAVPPLLPSFPGDTGHFLIVSASMALSPGQGGCHRSSHASSLQSLCLRLTQVGTKPIHTALPAPFPIFPTAPSLPTPAGSPRDADEELRAPFRPCPSPSREFHPFGKGCSSRGNNIALPRLWGH
uniref:Uncharacterized protein n=1 Tax=Junco hyemalis TaxID=40217 RepID=A0A8C5ITR0_JUNHY